MKRDLVNEKQPFGEVHNHLVHPSTMKDSPILSKTLGSTMAVGINALDHPPTTINIYSQAQDRAGKHKEDPFYWRQGAPKRSV
jgi:hypothetical protein